MTILNDDSHKLLLARVDDILRKSERGELVCGVFLSPGEAAIALSYAAKTHNANRVFLYGGYEDAERKRLYALPTFACDMDGEPIEKGHMLFDEELLSSVRAIEISGSGYRKLSHRDYLGSILALGIDRSAIGDIAVINDFKAIIFCTDKICAFLLGSIDRIGSDKVAVRERSVDDGFEIKRDFMPISSTVASNRLDCAIAAVTNLSREKAQELIRSGLCEYDYLEEIHCDREVSPPCVLSVRGHGKFRIRSFDGETRKGRLRIKAEKYI